MTNGRSGVRWLFVVAWLCLGLVLASPAAAACTSFAPGSDTTVICNGANAAGVLASGSDRVVLTVESGGTLEPATGRAVWLGEDADVTAASGSTIRSTNSFAMELGDGGTVVIGGQLEGQGGITGATVGIGGLPGLSNADVTINQGGQILITGGASSAAGIRGYGGGNTYIINGSILGTANFVTGVMVGHGDNLTIGATGSIVTNGAATSDAIGGGANNVTVNAADGGRIEIHGQGRAIDLGDNANVTFSGDIVSDAAATAINTGGGAGISVGVNSFVHLTSTGTIKTGNATGLGNQGDSGWGIVTFDSAGSNGTVIVDGTIETRRAHGIFSGTGDNITIGSTGRITVQTTGAHGIFNRSYTSASNFTTTITVGGRIEALGTGSAIFIQGDNAAVGVEAAQLTANVSVLAGGSLFAQNQIVYRQLDGAGVYPEVIDNLVIGGTVERGVTSTTVASQTIIDLNDGADKITLLPTYSFRANGAAGGIINGGSNAAAGTEIDTFALAGGVGTTGTFNFTTNQLLNFEAGSKEGAGMWVLEGTSGAGLGGTFDVAAGRLVVNGTISSALMNVGAGGTLGGTGTLAGGLTVAGIHAPGNSIGTQHVTGAYTMNGQLQVELNASGNSDLVNVTGGAVIGPAASVHVIPEAGVYTVGAAYRIIDASAARTGAFTTITDSSAFMQFALDHSDPNDVWLRLASISNFPAVAQTPNQFATATALQELGGALADAVTPLGEAEARAAFDLLSGEIHASVARAFIEDSRVPREAALDRVDAAFAAIEAQSGLGRDLWGRLIGSAGLINSDGNAASVNHATVGIMVGADGLVTDNLLLGFEAGVTQHGADAPDRASRATATGFHLGVYGGVQAEALRLRFGGAVSGYGIGVVRDPAFGGFVETLSSSHGAATAQVFGELGYAFTLGEATLEPFVRGALISHTGAGYAETGGAGALTGSIDPGLSGLVTLGMRGETAVVLAGSANVTAKGMIGMQHQFGANPIATHAFAGGSPFTVSAAGYGTALVAEVGLGFMLSETSTIDVSYKGSVAGSGVSGDVTATFTGSF